MAPRVDESHAEAAALKGLNPSPGGVDPGRRGAARERAVQQVIEQAEALSAEWATN